MEWLDPWWSTDEQSDDFHRTFEAQLKLEICADDDIYGIPVRIIGRGNGDDALFRLLDGTGRVALVHLQWGHLQGRIEDVFRTRSHIFANLEAFAELCMLPEHREWSAQ
jgi:hypothetical protein